MLNRTAKFAFAIFAGVLASTPLTTMSPEPADALDDCLSGPKEPTPPGAHWYYRVDHSNKRHCWYLKQDGEKVSQRAPRKTIASAQPAPPKTSTGMQHSIADARAELPAQTRTEQPNRARSMAAAISADGTVSEDNRDAKPAAVDPAPSVVASRWLGQSDTDPAANVTFYTSPTPLAGPMPGSTAPNGTVATSSAPNNADADSGSRTLTPSQSLPPTQSLGPATAAQFATPDLSSGNPSHSVQMLLAAMMGALGLAGLMGRAIFKFVGPRSPKKIKGSKRRGAIWKSMETGRRTSVVYPGADALPPRPDFPRDLDQARAEEDKIAEFFSKMSHHAPT
jgi:hypothetical protein